MTVQREWLDKDYYQVLGVAKTATDKEITRAYRKLAKQYHPDANPGSEDRFKEVSAAYDVLGDAAKRKEYDEVRRLGPMAGGFGGGFGGGGAGGTFHVDDLNDLFGGLFGGARARRARNAGQRGADVEAELTLKFEDAVNGATSLVHVTTDVTCSTCSGSGAASGSSPKRCERCGGSGTLSDNQGMFSLSKICHVCNGRGTTVDKPCPTCRGTGTERRAREVKVRIPPGVEDGQRIRVKGRGAAGVGNGPPGNLIVVVRVLRHHLFGRKGRNLTITVPITFPEATLGTQVRVPTLGDPVTLRIPPGTAGGKTFRVKGRGVPAGGTATTPGDLLVTVEVVVPKTLSDQQRAAVETLASVYDTNLRGYLEK